MSIFIDLTQERKHNKVKLKSTVKAESQNTFGAIMVVFYCKQTKEKNNLLHFHL